jgi:DnaK suppressor protein
MARQKGAANRERFEVLQSMLEARRQEIHDKLRFLRETLPAEASEVTDTEEQSVHDFVRDVELALMEMKAETLTKIDEALQRLQVGTYGTCAECGQEIAEARLRALPFATLCVSCQQQEESQDEEARAADRSSREFLSPIR